MFTTVFITVMKIRTSTSRNPWTALVLLSGLPYALLTWSVHISSKLIWPGKVIWKCSITSLFLEFHTIESEINWFQQDGDSDQSSGLDFSTLDYSGWGIVKDSVYHNTTDSIPLLKQLIVDAFTRFDENICSNIINSLHVRLADSIAN